MTDKKFKLQRDVIDKIEAWRSGAEKNRRPTINDVANVSKLSKKTVSRVINGSTLVRPATRAKVEAVIEQIGFVPDPQARGLAFKHSFLIGLVYDNPNPQYVVNIMEGILEELAGTEFELAIHRRDRANPNSIDDTVKFVKRQKLFGVILTPPISEDQKLAEALRESDCAFVRIASVKLDESARMITSNDRLGGYQAARHLIKLGHKDVAFVSGVKEFRSSAERRRGFEDGLKESGLSLPPNFVFEGAYTFESGISAAERMLSLRNRPTAVFAANDEMAAGVTHAARYRGLNVPRDLSVVGFDDFSISVTTWPRLTTIHSPAAELGRLAAAKLFAQQDLQTQPSSDETEPWLVMRESTAPPGKNTPD